VEISVLRRILGNSIEVPSAFVARALGRTGITPNQLTVIGTVINIAAGIALWNGMWRVGGGLILFAGVFDILDGALARNCGMGTNFGAFLDSTLDRISDAALYFGVLFYYACNGFAAMAFIVAIALVGAFMTSYTRARAECIIPKCEVGIIERPERIILLAAGALLSLMKPAIIILAFLSAVTVVQRLHFTSKALRRGAE